MNQHEIFEQIKLLRAELHRHNYNYYILDSPEISDYEFDQKMKKLQKTNPFAVYLVSN